VIRHVTSHTCAWLVACCCPPPMQLAQLLSSVLLEKPAKRKKGAGAKLVKGFSAALGCTIVEDIATHPHWTAHKDLALLYGLRACWSSPNSSRARSRSSPR